MTEKEKFRIFAQRMIDAWSIWLEEEMDMDLTSSSSDDKDIDIEVVRTLLASKVHEGKSEKIREILQVFHVDKLSDLPETNYEELVTMVEQI